MIRKTTNFAGITFSGIVKDEKHLGLARPILVKILESGNVKCHCTGKFSDDFAGDSAENFQRGEVEIKTLMDELNELKQLKAAPFILHLNTETKVIRFCPYQSIGFDISLK